MKIAIPVKTNGEDPALAPLFGKAKWFAFVEDDKVEIVRNPAQGGRAVIGWLIEQGVDAMVIQEMGATPYALIKAHGGIILLHAGYDRIVLSEVLERYRKKELVQLDDEKMSAVIARHESKHSHGGGHGHHH